MDLAHLSSMAKVAPTKQSPTTPLSRNTIGVYAPITTRWWRSSEGRSNFSSNLLSDRYLPPRLLSDLKWQSQRVSCRKYPRECQARTSAGGRQRARRKSCLVHRKRRRPVKKGYKNVLLLENGYRYR